MRATAVIGSCFGDEGKGLLVDFLSAEDPADTVVVRHNGGAQAGHTVVRPPDRRHSFAHVGAGTFAGAATYLSRYFIVNPLLWKKEQDELSGPVLFETMPPVALRPPVYVDPAALFTTPYDMLANQEIERNRGEARHGSCGAGINETVTRSQTLPGHIGKADSVAWLEDFLRVSRNYALDRVKTEVVRPSDLFLYRLYSADIREEFLGTMALFLKQVEFSVDIPKRYGRVIFEGAQGLLLDEKHEFFPHVTRSRTGLTNVGTICRRNQIRDLDVVYVTRPYMTRHGPGPFPTEDPALSFPDETNVANVWQGRLRFGRLDVPLVGAAVRRDLREANATTTRIQPWLAVTHLDQVADDAVSRPLTDETGVPVAYRSRGPCREDVVSTRGGEP